jgi:hypothetical protein
MPSRKAAAALSSSGDHAGARGPRPRRCRERSCRRRGRNDGGAHLEAVAIDPADVADFSVSRQRRRSRGLCGIRPYEWSLRLRPTSISLSPVAEADELGATEKSEVADRAVRRSRRSGSSPPRVLRRPARAHGSRSADAALLVGREHSVARRVVEPDLEHVVEPGRRRRLRCRARWGSCSGFPRLCAVWHLYLRDA